MEYNIIDFTRWEKIFCSGTNCIVLAGMPNKKANCNKKSIDENSAIVYNHCHILNGEVQNVKSRRADAM